MVLITPDTGPIAALGSMDPSEYTMCGSIGAGILLLVVLLLTLRKKKQATA